MRDIRQSLFYAKYLQSIGWHIEKIDSTFIFIKKFPLFGSVIKIQRPEKLVSTIKLKVIANKYHARSIILEKKCEEQGSVSEKITNSPYLPTKTIHIDLSASEEKLFNNLSEAKRRAVRRAKKNNIKVKISTIQVFSHMKQKDLWPLGYFGKRDIEKLWEAFPTSNKVILAGFEKDLPIAAVFLLFYDKCGYYWMATSTRAGKKTFAPTLLVWESILFAKKKKCLIFDFEGIYDERFHEATKHWKGFTKFKEGFGGGVITFPKPVIYNI